MPTFVFAMGEDKDFLPQDNNYRTLIHQCAVLIRGLIEWKKRNFMERGGIKEKMCRARKEWQRKNGAPSPP